MDRIEVMSILLAVADAGSLSAGARRLGLPLATVSRKIAALEAHLGARLLDRSSRRAAPTAAGQAYAEACRRILDEVAEAERTAGGAYSAPKGTLAVAAPIVFGRLHVLPVVVAFLAAFPDITTRLMLADGVASLLQEPIDVAVRIGALPDSALVARRVGAVRTVVCASPGYLARRGTPRVPADLAGHDCVTFEGLAAADAWRFADGRREAAVAVRSRLTVNTAEAAVDAAVAGVGPTRVLSYQVAPAVAAGALQIVLEDFEPAPWPVSLVHAGRRPLAAKLRAFVDFAAPRLRAVPGVGDG